MLSDCLRPLALSIEKAARAHGVEQKFRITYLRSRGVLYTVT